MSTNLADRRESHRPGASRDAVRTGLSRRLVLGSAAFSILGATASRPAGAAAPAVDAKLLAEDFRIPSADPGITLFLRNKRLASLDRFRPDRTLLFVHGGTQGSTVTFDLTLDGESWADYIAKRGWDVWTVDVRGYGYSTKPPEAEAPIARTEDAWKDFGTAVDHILAKRSIARLNTLGWSWGSVITGGYASRNPDKVARVALFGPNWSYRSTAPAPSGSYITWTVREAFERLQRGAPPEARAGLTPESWYKAWEAATIATDDQAARTSPARVRSPSGVWVDIAELSRTNSQFYDPAKLKAATLIVIGEWDANLKGSRELFERLSAVSEKRLVELGQATHFAHVERNRYQLFNAVQGFLEA